MSREHWQLCLQPRQSSDSVHRGQSQAVTIYTSPVLLLHLTDLRRRAGITVMEEEITLPNLVTSGSVTFLRYCQGRRSALQSVRSPQLPQLPHSSLPFLNVPFPFWPTSFHKNVRHWVSGRPWASHLAHRGSLCSTHLPHAPASRSVLKAKWDAREACLVVHSFLSSSPINITVFKYKCLTHSTVLPPPTRSSP